MKNNDKVYLAVDLGASSGRVVAGLFDGNRLRLEEVHRFTNGAVQVRGRLHWNILGLYAAIQEGLMKAARDYGSGVCALGVDTWGVDYAWLDNRGRLMSMPVCYRDSRTDGMMEAAFDRLPRRNIYERTGIQFMPLNTLYQLLSEVFEDSTAMKHGQRLLFTPDLLNYWLTGTAANELTISSTSQLLQAGKGKWDIGLLQAMDIPSGVFGEPVAPGTELGNLLPETQHSTGLGAIPVIAPGSHDTASAVAAVPAAGDNFLYLSSGTWSLMGIEVREPIINDQTYAADLTNEAGVCGTIRLLKNIAGLWLIQESRRTWQERGEEITFDEMDEQAGRAEPFRSVVVPDDPLFLQPGDMPARIAEFCRRSGQPAPLDKGQTVRAALEGLALKYRQVLDTLELITGRRLEPLHIVGGGSRNVLLNRMAADATGRTVITGPSEATAAGNILMQMLATGAIDSLHQGRRLLAESFPRQTYEPLDTDRWEDAYTRFKSLS